MKARFLAFLLALCCLAPVALAESPTPVAWFDENAVYTAYVPPTDAVVTRAWLEENSQTDVDEAAMEESGFCLDESITTETLPGAYFKQDGLIVASASPDGKTLLLMLDGKLAAFDGEALRVCYADIPRCKPTEKRGYQMSIKLSVAFQKVGIGREGFAWSPDGRYVCLQNYDTVFVKGQNAYSLTLIDTQTGGMAMVRATDSKIFDAEFFISGACFSEDSRYLYYASYEKVLRVYCVLLRRYEPASGRDDVLCALPDFTAGCAGLCRAADGTLRAVVTTLDSDRESSLATFTPGADGGDAWTYTLEPLEGLFAKLLQCGGDTTLLEYVSRADHNMTARFALIDGGARQLEIALTDGEPRASLSALPATREEAEAALNAESRALFTGERMQICYAALSPDGRRAALYCRRYGERAGFEAYLLDTNTLALTPLSLSDMPGFDAFLQKTAANRYSGGMRFISDDCLLAPTSWNGMALYRLGAE